MSDDQLVTRFRNRDRGALARTLTFIENDNPRANDLLDQLHAETGSARIIGVTGPPGAGKSTLTNALIKEFRQRGESVGVLAVDPSSSLSGGATLGDRIRMLETYSDDEVYIRSMATRGQYGGLTMATGRATQALDAFGFDIIILETVGVGQDEVDIASSADTVLLLQVPGLGDSIQTIKAGILEIADIIVVNKAELPDARTLQRDLRSMLRYRGHSDWEPPIVPTVSTTGEGLSNLLAEVDRHQQFLEQSGEGTRRRGMRARSEVRRLVRRDLERLIDDQLAADAGQALIDAVINRECSPRSAANRLVEQIIDRSTPKD